MTKVVRQMWVSCAGPPEVLLYKETRCRELGEEEVRIRVEAIGVNFADVLTRLGRYPQAPPLPLVPGFEVAGVVEEVGVRCVRLKRGERVVAICRFGGYASEVVALESLTLPIPDAVSFDTAAALPVAYLTALLLVERQGRVRPGERVLIHSGAGGVGLALIDFCLRRQARITALASPEKHDFLKRRGVENIIDSRAADYVGQVRDVVGSSGFDVIFDSRGGSAWHEGYKLLSPLGRLCVFGFSDIVRPAGEALALHSRQLGEGAWFRFDAFDLVNDNRAVVGLNLATLWHAPAFLLELPSLFSNIWRGCAEGYLVPWIGGSFSLKDAPRAHQALQSRATVGKLILHP